MSGDSSSLVGSRHKWYAVLWGLIASEGGIALVAALWIPSETGSASLFGYSLSRLALAATILIGIVLSSGVMLASWKNTALWQRLAEIARRFAASDLRLSVLFLALCGFLGGIVAFFVLAFSPAARELVILRSLVARLGIALVWVELAIIKFGVMLWLSLGDERSRLVTPLLGSSLLVIVTGLYTGALKIYMTAMWDIRMRHVEEYIFLPAVIFLVWSVIWQKWKDKPWYPSISRYFLLLSLGVLAYTVYRHTAQWMEWQINPSKAYWHLLADAFLHGKLYLDNPGTTHDLTLFNGHWYVPNPPLPALILVPLVAVVGVNGVNTILFSIVCGAINVVLVYLLLEQASIQGLIFTNRTGNLWLTAVFTLGTTHWWLAIMGRMWFISQVLTVLFATLAALLTLRRASPWLIGASLGAAVLSRPNLFTLYPFLVGLMLFLDTREGNRVGLKRLLGWIIQSALPVCLAVGGLLYYNEIRFGNLWDFGYVSITSSDWLMDAVTTYGIFNLHFLPINLHAMFLKMPILEMRDGCLYYSPTREGISIFAMTPAVIYIFRHFLRNWWVAGAWISIILSAGLLLFYHNTGAWQLGYRYLMDFILPVLLLMGLGIGRRPSVVFKALVGLSILGNAAGIIWWFEKWWC